MTVAIANRTCVHGQPFQGHGRLAQEEADAYERDGMAEGIMEFYVACDCCDALMHNSCSGEGYKLMATGETLCLICVGDRKDFLVIP